MSLLDWFKQAEDDQVEEEELWSPLSSPLAYVENPTLHDLGLEVGDRIRWFWREMEHRGTVRSLEKFSCASDTYEHYLWVIETIRGKLTTVWDRDDPEVFVGLNGDDEEVWEPIFLPSSESLR